MVNKNSFERYRASEKTRRKVNDVDSERAELRSADVYDRLPFLPTMCGGRNTVETFQGSKEIKRNTWRVRNLERHDTYIHDIIHTLSTTTNDRIVY